MRRNFYGHQTEINLRDELNNTIDGFFPEISKSQTGLIRKIKRDVDGKMLECACRSNPFKEAEKDLYCPLCLGIGYYWEETFVDFYMWEPGYDTALALREMLSIPGDVASPLQIFYLKYSENLTKEDRMVTLVLDKEGFIKKPYTRKEIYRLGTVRDYRSDNGRLEFWKAVGWLDTTVPVNTRR